MLKLQLFGTEQKVFGILRTTFGTVYCICPHGRIFFLAGFTCSSPAKFHGLEECPPKERNLSISNEGPIPSPAASSNGIWQRSAFLGFGWMEFSLHAAQHWQYARLQFPFIHFPFPSAEILGLPTMDSCP